MPAATRTSGAESAGALRQACAQPCPLRDLQVVTLRASLRLLPREPTRNVGTCCCPQQGRQAGAGAGAGSDGPRLQGPLQPRQTVMHLGRRRRRMATFSESHFEIKIFKTCPFRHPHSFQSIDLQCHLFRSSPLHPTNIHQANELALI